jgi:hypothetical protein
VSGVLFGWVDPGGAGQLRWLRCGALKTVRMGDEGGVERDGATGGEFAGATMVNDSGRHQTDAGVVMLGVVPVEEGLAVGPSIFD